MSNKVFELIRDNKKVEIYQDIDPMCPCCDWDMVTKFLFGYSDSRDGRLSPYCNYEDFTKEARDCTIHEAVEELVLRHVSGTQIFNFCKKEGLIYYNSSTKLWEAETGDEFTKKEIIELKWGADPFHEAELSDLVSLLDRHGKDILIEEFSSSGYCQGDYIEGVIYVTKDRYKKMDGTPGDWKAKAREDMRRELEIMEKWFWGDVYGFISYENVKVEKHFPELPDRPVETYYEWEQKDSCYGFYDEPEQLAEDVLSGAV